MKRGLVTGSEGKIGKRICLELSRDYQVIQVDITLGYDLTNPEVVQKIFANSDPIYAVINCHAHNPIPTKQEAKKEPVDFSLDELRSYVEVNLISLFVYSSGVKIFPGSETKSLVKFTPFKIASSLALIF